MPNNAAGLDVSGNKNPNWKGGLISKSCEVCKISYKVKIVHKDSRFCSLQCVGKSQRGSVKIPPEDRRIVGLECETCGTPYSVPAAHAKRYRSCSRKCSYARRSLKTKGNKNPSWAGGVSRLPYPWNFREISRNVIERDGSKCWNPDCAGRDKRMTTHHINYEKSDCHPSNLICLCSACNSKANFGRQHWMALYQALMADRDDISMAGS